MTTANIIFMIMFTLVAVSYGWGMRGDLIGGEEGAMLPGAFLGLGLALFSGIDVFRDNFMLFTAVGAASMYMGGTEPYAQTMFRMYHNNPDRNVASGYLGLALKGGPWFGIAGGFLGMSFTAVTGAYYKAYDFAILFAAIILMRFLCIKLINSPHDPKNNVFPKIYFSSGSREEWAGLWGIMIAMAVYMIIRGDFFGLKMMISGTVTGGLGFGAANLLNTETLVKMKNGKYLFGKFQENGRIDNWKIMEFSFGIFGSIGIVLCYILNYKTIESYGKLCNGTLWNPLGDKVSLILSIVFIVLIVLDALHHLINQPLYKGDLEDKFKAGRMTQWEYNRLMKKASDKPVSESYNRYVKLVELCRRPLFSYSVLALCLLGVTVASKFAATELLIWACAEELCFVSLDKIKGAPKKGATVLSLIVIAVVSVIHITVGLSALALFLILALSYLFATAYVVLCKIKENLGKTKVTFKEIIDNSQCSLTVKGHYCVCIIISAVVLIINHF